MTTGSSKRAWPATLPFAVGIFALSVLVGVIGFWSVKARISGAVVSSGMIEVKLNRQVIQHPDGGVVGEIMVRDGDSVAAGDTLILIDGSFLRTELAVVESQYFETLARKARLEAERDGENTLTPDAVLSDRTRTEPQIANLLAGQERLFAARIQLRQEQLELLGEDIAQLENQFIGTEAQLTALSQQKELVDKELKDVLTLFDKGLILANRVSALRKEAARLSGDIGGLTSEQARLLREKTAVEIRVLTLETTRRQEAITVLRDLGQQEIELSERRGALRERLSRLAIRAPVAGTIHGSTVFALQSVVRPAEPLMFVVPQGQELVVSTKIDSIDIDQVVIGQEAALRFLSFDGRRTPEILGEVAQVSADTFIEETTGAPYYSARILISDDEIAKLDGQALLPGMPVEVFIKTTDRTPLEYLTQPLTDYFARAFREG